MRTKNTQVIRLFITILVFMISQNNNPSLCQQKVSMEERLIEIQEATEAIAFGKSTIEKFISEFAFIYKKDPETTAQIVKLIIKNYSLYPDQCTRLLRNKFEYLRPEEYYQAREVLERKLTEERRYYYEIISLFDLRKKIPDLEKQLDSNLMDTVWSMVKVNQKIPLNYKKQLKIKTTLANLGEAGHEREILTLIRKAYQNLSNYRSDYIDTQKDTISSVFKVERKTLYWEILPYTLGQNYLKSTIMETLYLLNDRGKTDETFDVSGYYYSKNLYKRYIANKVFIVGPPFFERDDYIDIEILKKRLSDDTVWRSYMK